MKNTIRKYSPILAAAIAAQLPIHASALSLNEAVANQLATPVGGLGCQAFLDAGGTAQAGSGLETICGRFVPAGSPTSSDGGGSATPVAIPSADAGFVDETQKSNEAKQEVISAGNNFSFFFTAENESLDREESDNEGAFDSTRNRFVAGVMYMPSTNVSFSLAYDTNSQDGDFANGGEFSSDSSGFRLLTSFRPTDKLSFQVALASDSVEAERQRVSSFDDLANGVSIFSVAGTPESEYDYDQFAYTLRGAYEFSSGRLTLSPTFGYDALSADYGTYSETGDSGLELTFHNDERESAQLFVGLQGSYAMGTSWGAFIPQFDLTLRNELESDARTVEVSFVQDTASTRFEYETEEQDSQFMDVSIGGVFVFKNGTQAFVNVQTLMMHDYYDRLIASAGVRIEL